MISIHGITPKDVKNSPKFDELWQDLHPMVNGKFLIAHNAGFDISVLRRTLETYQLPFPNIQYSCSYIFSRKVWVGLPSYDLKTLCRVNEIPLVHHRAGPDSEATAKLAIKAFEKAEILTMEDFPDKLRTIVGRLYDGGYKPSTTKYIASQIEEIIGDPTKHKLESIFYGRNVVFTGTLSSMKRTDAKQIIADIGAINGESVTKATDFLIVGQQDYRIVGDEGMSSKQM